MAGPLGAHPRAAATSRGAPNHPRASRCATAFHAKRHLSCHRRCARPRPSQRRRSRRRRPATHRAPTAPARARPRRRPRRPARPQRAGERARVASRREADVDLDHRDRVERRHHELGRLHRAHERARQDVRRLAVVPAQPVAERARLLPAVRREVTVRVAQVERLVDRLGMADQEHLHAPNPSTISAGEARTAPPPLRSCARSHRRRRDRPPDRAVEMAPPLGRGRAADPSTDPQGAGRDPARRSPATPIRSLSSIDSTPRSPARQQQPGQRIHAVLDRSSGVPPAPRRCRGRRLAVRDVELERADAIFGVAGDAAPVEHVRRGSWRSRCAARSTGWSRAVYPTSVPPRSRLFARRSASGCCSSRPPQNMTRARPRWPMLRDRARCPDRRRASSRTRPRRRRSGVGATPRWLVQLLPWTPVEAGVYRVNQALDDEVRRQVQPRRRARSCPLAFSRLRDEAARVRADARCTTTIEVAHAHLRPVPQPDGSGEGAARRSRSRSSRRSRRDELVNNGATACSTTSTTRHAHQAAQRRADARRSRRADRDGVEGAGVLPRAPAGDRGVRSRVHAPRRAAADGDAVRLAVPHLARPAARPVRQAARSRARRPTSC